MKRPAAALLGWAASLFACTDVADERTVRDESVGHYYDNGIRIDVDDGLAVVRAVTSNRIAFWSSAPGWSATILRDVSTPLTVEIRNLIPGSTLEVRDSKRELREVRIETDVVPTQRRFLVERPSQRMSMRIIAPTAERPPPFRFAVLGDIQGAIVEVQDIYQRIAEESELDFVICPGDLTEQGKREQLLRFERELEQLPIPFYATLGNHELGTTPPPYQELFGRANLHFRYRGTGFSLIDSASATVSPRAMQWLGDWLDEERSRVHVFVTHYPPIDPIGVRNGSFASRNEAHQLIARLAEGRVDLSLHGHVHSYYAFTLAGIPAYISGGGGAIPERFDDIGRHFLVVQVDVGPEGRSRIGAVDVVRVD